MQPFYNLQGACNKGVRSTNNRQNKQNHMHAKIEVQANCFYKRKTMMTQQLIALAWRSMEAAVKLCIRNHHKLQLPYLWNGLMISFLMWPTVKIKYPVMLLYAWPTTAAKVVVLLPERVSLDKEEEKKIGFRDCLLWGMTKNPHGNTQRTYLHI